MLKKIKFLLYPPLIQKNMEKQFWFRISFSLLSRFSSLVLGYLKINLFLLHFSLITLDSTESRKQEI